MTGIGSHRDHKLVVCVNINLNNSFSVFFRHANHSQKTINMLIRYNYKAGHITVSENKSAEVLTTNSPYNNIECIQIYTHVQRQCLML